MADDEYDKVPELLELLRAAKAQSFLGSEEVAKGIDEHLLGMVEQHHSGQTDGDASDEAAMISIAAALTGDGDRTRRFAQVSFEAAGKGDLWNKLSAAMDDPTQREQIRYYALKGVIESYAQEGDFAGLYMQVDARITRLEKQGDILGAHLAAAEVAYIAEELGIETLSRQYWAKADQYAERVLETGSETDVYQDIESDPKKLC